MILDLNKYINFSLLTNENTCKDNVITIKKTDGPNRYFLFPVETLKEKCGNKFTASLHYSGALILKFGITSKYRAYRWFAEKTLAETEEGTEQFELDLENLDSGMIEIFIRSTSTTARLFCHASLALEKQIAPELVLYDFVSPSHELCSEEALYYRFSGQKKEAVCYYEDKSDNPATGSLGRFSGQKELAYYYYEDKSVRLGAGSSVDLVTYFNAFSSCKWKKYTNVDTISVFLDFEGMAVAQIVHETIYGESILSSWNLNTAHRAVFELPACECPENGIIGLRIYAEKDSILYGGGYLTDAPQTQKVHLGIGITTYRREKAVISSVARLAKAIAAHPFYHDVIDITVVDNGQTLSAEDMPDATLIPNENLGGSGGFMRNLIHYQDKGNYTHCVFMDDDASCEPGCIFRSISFLRHLNDPSIAISGAMLIDTDPAIQWEKGAYFEGYCKAIHRGYNVTDVDTLVKNELEDGEQRQLYGAWWFFMFPLSKVEMSVFPYFVRGDDVEFSYTNKFNIVTMNGICSLQGDFCLKDNPITHYFLYRCLILLNILISNRHFNLLYIVCRLLGAFVNFNLSYHYDSANVVVLVLKNALKGPDYWINDINTSKIREYIKKKYKMEVIKLIDIDKSNMIPIGNIKYSFIKKVLIFISLNGHLFPKSILDKNNYYINKFYERNTARLFNKQSVIVYDEINKVGYKLTRNCYYFIRNIILMSFYTFLFMIKYPFIKKRYLNFYKKLKNGTFWRSLYKIETK